MTERRRLPNRRRSEIVDFQHGGRRWSAAVSRFDDGRIAEIFLSSARDSTIARLAEAIVASIALQFGADVSTIRHAIESTSAGPLSAALVLLEEGER
jgi:hypothetical protein